MVQYIAAFVAMFCAVTNVSGWKERIRGGVGPGKGTLYRLREVYIMTM